MASAIISVVAERITTIIEEQIRNEVSLVRGVDKEALDLSHELKRITNVLDDAEKRGFKEKSVKDWLKRLEDTSYEMDDVLDEWNIALLKLQMEQQSNHDTVAPKQKVYPSILSSCLCFKKVVVRHDIAKKIINVKEQLDLILAEKDLYNFVTSQPIDLSRELWRVQSTSLIDLAKVHGRESDTDIIVDKLMATGGSQGDLSIHILSIVGVGGLGKTTLAQVVYNDSRIKEYFQLRMWICVSNPFDVVGIAKEITESVKEGSSPNTNQLDILLRHMVESISGKRFLLVLDDVWTEDYEKWEPLKESLRHGGPGSRILVTTRNERVAKMMGTRDSEICRLGQLSDEDCWLLLCRMALFGRNEEEFENFQEIGKRIANKCKGLPLAAKTLGSLLRFKNSLEEWENVLNNEIWQLEKAEVELFPHLLLSYNELSPPLKRCFSYCAILPKDSEIDVERLIGNWMALGFLGSNVGSTEDIELRGREYFDILAMRSLFQDFRKSDVDGQIKWCKMHDVVYDFAKFLMKNGRAGAAGMTKKKCQVCNPLLVSNVKEYRSIFCDKELPPSLCDCLATLRVLGITNCKMHSIARGMEKLIHLRWLDINSSLVGDVKAICNLYNMEFLWLTNCNLEEIPREIGNLIHLRHLDLSNNDLLKELPESICGLHELRTLNIDGCDNLCGLPEEIHRLINLKHLHNKGTHRLNCFPQGLAQFTSLRTLSQLRGGSGWSKLGLLKNLNLLRGSLTLQLRLSDGREDLVEDAREAELRKKTHIQTLEITFKDEMEESSRRMDVIEALEPHPNLRNLHIFHFKGFHLPYWIASPVNQLRYIHLSYFDHLLSLPPLGKLPYLEEIKIDTMRALQFVGREFLGITTIIRGDKDFESSSSMAAAANTVAFPKLKKLTFCKCYDWRSWEDITAKEEESPAVTLMPCLTELTIQFCYGLTSLPLRLLRKASSLKVLDVRYSEQLAGRYGEDPGLRRIQILRN